MSIMNIVDIAQIASALAAVGSFVGSIIVYKRSVNRECKLETLRKLTELRMKYPSMEEISNNDKLDYIVDHEKPSYTRMMIQLLIAFMFIMITGTTVWNSFYTLLLLISPVLFLLYPIIIIFFFNSGTVLCNAILIPAENDDENTEYFQ